MKALQDRYAPDNICFGCGSANARGLQIKSFVDGDGVIASFTPQEHHQALPGVINGGIIGALFDCHMNWAAAHDLMGDSGSLPATVTSEFTVRFTEPTPAGTELQLRAWVTERSRRMATVEATLEAAGETTARASGVFVAVSEGHPAYDRW